MDVSTYLLFQGEAQIGRSKDQASNMPNLESADRSLISTRERSAVLVLCTRHPRFWEDGIAFESLELSGYFVEFLSRNKYMFCIASPPPLPRPYVR